MTTIESTIRGASSSLLLLLGVVLGGCSGNPSPGSAAYKQGELGNGAFLSNAVRTVDMDAIVTGDASLGNVTLGGTALAYNDPNGWMLESNAYSVTLVGTACTTFKAGSQLDIDFPCDPSGNPIAVHR